MVFKATFNNISVISWRSVLLVEVTRRTVPGENQKTTDLQQDTDKLYITKWCQVSSAPRLSGVRTHNIIYKLLTLNKSKYNCHNTYQSKFNKWKLKLILTHFFLSLLEIHGNSMTYVTVNL